MDLDSRPDTEWALDADLDAVFSLLDQDLKAAAFESAWKKLQLSDADSVPILKLCIKLLPLGDQHASFVPELKKRVLDCIYRIGEDQEQLSSLAETCLRNERLASELHYEAGSLFIKLLAALSCNWKETDCFVQSLSSKNGLVSQDQALVLAQSVLRFLQCSYWYSPDEHPFVSSRIVEGLCGLLGFDALEQPVTDTLSALLAYLHSQAIARRDQDEDIEQHLYQNTTSEYEFVNPRFSAQSLWSQFLSRQLADDCFATQSSPFYKIWFQWVSLATLAGIDLNGLYTEQYWRMLRRGLMIGFAEQRKYCLGILRQSMAIPWAQDFNIPPMNITIARQAEHQKEYDKFSSLFETIVLDRYPNQVEACLSELNAIAKSDLVSPAWVTALLTAALHPKIQDGVRKLVGGWYMRFVAEAPSRVLDQHSTFLIAGFLPWATVGSLFTSSLISTRHSTTCGHGTALSGAVRSFITAAPDAAARGKLVLDILRFVRDNADRMFKYAILYLMEGLLEGLGEPGTMMNAHVGDLGIVTEVSRLPGFPEIATDLCTVYCLSMCDNLSDKGFPRKEIHGIDVLEAQDKRLTDEETLTETAAALALEPITTFAQFVSKLADSQHKCIQDDSFPSACNTVIRILTNTDASDIEYDDLCEVLEAIWEEIDRREFKRSFAIQIPPLYFHTTCIQLCAKGHADAEHGDRLTNILSNTMLQTRQLSEGRSYLLFPFYESVRRACLAVPVILEILPVQEALLSFVSIPPTPIKEFLFEIAAAEQLQKYDSHRDYGLYYGKREWHAYACVIDLINRWPSSHLHVAKSILDQLLHPWKTQKRPIPIISKWKETFQLQVMLLLSESCISAEEAPSYLEDFMSALVLEPWPRYRYLLEWVICRIYYRFPHLSDRILPDLAKLDDLNPIQIASLMKLAVLTAPLLDSEDFALRLMTQLIPFSASPKVHVRHEAHWSFPIVFELAERKRWTSINENPAFRALYEHIVSLDKYSKPAWTIRTLKLDAVEDFTLVNIFQGEYLTIEMPESEFVAYEDFKELEATDRESLLEVPQARVPLGTAKPAKSDPEPIPAHHNEDGSTTKPHEVESAWRFGFVSAAQSQTPAPLQTKSGFDTTSLLPHPGPPSSANQRPASVILVASLIDNPTNLGGLSRIAESFGLEALYIDNLKKVEHRDFKATAVTSYKHLPIRELKVEEVSGWLVRMKGEGWTVVGVEQTDASGILGEEEVGQINRKGVGTLPKKCVLVLGAEKTGITAEVLSVLDRCVEIRTVGVTRSLNVQTAGGIACFEWWREWGPK